MLKIARLKRHWKLCSVVGASIMVHEFGHTIGLDHSAGWEDIMIGRVRELEPCSPSTLEPERCGLSTNDKEGIEAIYEHHTAH